MPIFLFGGRGWEEECWALACAKTTTVTETLTTFKFKCCFYRTGNFVFKAPICFSISFGLGIISHKVLSETLICSCNNNELRNVPTAKLFISCTGQCPVFCNNSLKTPGSFGPFSSCSDEATNEATNAHAIHIHIFCVNAKLLTSLKAHFWN